MCIICPQEEHESLRRAPASMAWRLAPAAKRQLVTKLDFSPAFLGRREKRSVADPGWTSKGFWCRAVRVLPGSGSSPLQQGLPVTRQPQGGDRRRWRRAVPARGRELAGSGGEGGIRTRDAGLPTYTLSRRATAQNRRKWHQLQALSGTMIVATPATKKNYAKIGRIGNIGSRMAVASMALWGVLGSQYKDAPRVRSACCQSQFTAPRRRRCGYGLELCQVLRSRERS